MCCIHDCEQCQKEELPQNWQRRGEMLFEVFYESPCKMIRLELFREIRDIPYKRCVHDIEVTTIGDSTARLVAALLHKGEHVM
jgi:hypothetical protein